MSHSQAVSRTRRHESPVRRPGLSGMILIGLLAGIACGVFFGEYCTPMGIVGRAFIGLLQMTVLPYVVVSIVANLGRLSLRQSRRLAIIGGLVLLSLWTVCLLMVWVLPLSFPTWKSGSFFSTSMAQPPPSGDLLDLFIPSNFFAALAENHVPAVVLLCMFAGLALAGLEHRHVVITQLDLLAKVLVRVNGFVIRLAPIGVFAIAANTAGTISLAEVGRLQAYMVSYTAGALFLAFIVLPLLVTTCTPFRYAEVMAVSRDSMVTAFATGKLIIVLPLLIEQTENLFERFRNREETGTAPAVDVLYPVAYPFPHVGKLLAMLFIPFAAWFLGHTLHWEEYPAFLVSGLFSYFAGPLVATPFLLDQMHLPHDMFELFLVSGIYCGRLGDALGVMHLVAFTILTTCAFTGRLRLRWTSLAQYLVLVATCGIVLIAVMRMGLGRSLQLVQDRESIIASMQLLDEPVESVVLTEASPSPDAMRDGETLLQRIRRRGIIRVGFNADKLPFAYFNAVGDLVGFDVNMAHALARDLGVRIEFVPYSHETLARQLVDDHFDVVMSGLVGTLELAESTQHTSPYMDLTLSMVVRDYRSRDFRSVDSMRSIEDLRIGFVELSRGFVDRLKARLPNAEFVELATNRQFFMEPAAQLDALLISAESGSAFTLLHPDFEVVVPDGPHVSLPLIYAIAHRDAAMQSFLEYWIALRKKNGTMQENYDHWILGRSPRQEQPRWCVVRDVLGWVQ